MRIFNLPAVTKDCSLEFRLPCGRKFAAGGLCSCDDPCWSLLQVGGDPNIIYNVPVTFIGLVEMKGYSGGTNDGQWFQIGGSPINSTNNIYGIRTLEPYQDYFVNRVYDPRPPCNGGLCPIHYTKVIPIRGASWVVLRVQTIDKVEIVNFTGIKVPGVVDPPQPYDGQFLKVIFDCSVFLPVPGS